MEEESEAITEVQQEPLTTDYPIREWVVPAFPGEEMLEDPDYWKNLLYDLVDLYPSEFDWGTIPWGNNSERIASRLVLEGVADRLTQVPSDDPSISHTVITPEELRALLDLCYGPAITQAVFDDPYEITYTDDGNILLRLNYNVKNRINYNQYIVREVTPVDGMKKIRLEAERYEGGRIGNLRRLDSLHTYELYWDDHMGYVPSRITWEYVPTDRVTIEGDVTVFETLWGLEADAQTLLYGFDVDTSTSVRSLQAIGDIVYRFAIDGGSLVADTLDLVTLEQQTGVGLHTFHEEITRLRLQEGSLLVFTDSALYLLDDRFRQVDRRPWPQALPEDVEDLVISDDISMVSYSYGDDGLFLCAMEPDAQPHLLAAHPRTWEEAQKEAEQSGEFISHEYLYPIRFLDGGRLFAGVSMWEHTGRFLVMDLQGAELDRVLMSVSGPLAGGYYSHNRQGALFFDQFVNTDQEERGNYFYDFTTQILERADWLDLTGFNPTYRYLSDLSAPNTWYLSIPVPDFEPEYTLFTRVDTRARTFTQLPVKADGAAAALLAVGQEGRLLFLYGYKGETGFGVTAPMG